MTLWRSSELITQNRQIWSMNLSAKWKEIFCEWAVKRWRKKIGLSKSLRLATPISRRKSYFNSVGKYTSRYVRKFKRSLCHWLFILASRSQTEALRSCLKSFYASAIKQVGTFYKKKKKKVDLSGYGCFFPLHSQCGQINFHMKTFQFGLLQTVQSFVNFQNVYFSIEGHWKLHSAHYFIFIHWHEVVIHVIVWSESYFCFPVVVKPMQMKAGWYRVIHQVQRYTSAVVCVFIKTVIWLRPLLFD